MKVGQFLEILKEDSRKNSIVMIFTENSIEVFSGLASEVPCFFQYLEVSTLYDSKIYTNREDETKLIFKIYVKESFDNISYETNCLRLNEIKKQLHELRLEIDKIPSKVSLYKEFFNNKNALLKKLEEIQQQINKIIENNDFYN